MKKKRARDQERSWGKALGSRGCRGDLSCWSCASDRDSCHVSSRGNQSAPAACRSCTQPLLRTGPALSDAHIEPKKTCSRVRGFCSSAVMKREFVQPRARQNSPWAKSEKVTVWSHEREQRFVISNLFFNLRKTVLAWSY